MFLRADIVRNEPSRIILVAASPQQGQSEGCHWRLLWQCPDSGTHGVCNVRFYVYRDIAAEAEASCDRREPGTLVFGLGIFSIMRVATLDPHGQAKLRLLLPSHRRGHRRLKKKAADVSRTILLALDPCVAMAVAFHSVAS